MSNLTYEIVAGILGPQNSMTKIEVSGAVFALLTWEATKFVRSAVLSCLESFLAQYHFNIGRSFLKFLVLGSSKFPMFPKGN